ncbi:YuiB family protein [Bacillus sp. 2205SS5-2]|uniref:YuiB family protein n=1 Tax=Bacillus sp. 2205SS5-2 TaxID=3109031 RepID=UPI0030061E59
MNIAQFVLSILIFFVLFYSIGFILNMLLRMTWVMAIIYPVITIFIIDEVRFIAYFKDPGTSFSSLGEKIGNLATVDVVILVSGLAGAIVSGLTSRILRKKGYQMF